MAGDDDRLDDDGIEGPDARAAAAAAGADEPDAFAQSDGPQFAGTEFEDTADGGDDTAFRGSGFELDDEEDGADDEAVASRLEAEALRAAEDAIDAGERALEEAGDFEAGDVEAGDVEDGDETAGDDGRTEPTADAGTETARQRSAPRAPQGAFDDATEAAAAEAGTEAGEVAAAADMRRTWLLRGLLFVNVALMGLVLALPSRTTTTGGSDAAGGTNDAAASNAAQPAASGPAGTPRVSDYTSPGGERFVSERRDRPRLAPRDLRFEAAVDAAMEQDYGRAIAILERLVDDPTLSPTARETYYTMLSRYADLDGRTEDSLRWMALANAQRRPGTQPEDLLALAERAQREGDAQLMRRSYARFLLMRDQLSPAMLDRVTEIYLRLGDSYRLEARVGAEEAASHDEKLLEEIRQHNEILRRRSVESNSTLDGSQFTPYPGKSLDVLDKEGR